jgi:hypothetical protein
MADKLWFGIPGSHMQFVPCPSIDSVVQRNRYVERMQFENGGGDARRSAQYQMEYQFNFSGPAHEVEGIDAFNKFAQGFYGDGLIQLAHPATFETNLFPAAWASPGLIEQGWANIGSTVPSFANTNVTSYGQPPRTATWDVTQQAGTFTKSVTIVIPPTHTLNIGASGVRPSGSTAVVRVVPIDTAGDAGTPVDLTLLSKSSSTRMNATFAGSSFQAVRVYITRTTSAASTISVTSMMAQLYKTGLTPALPTTHYQGEGSTGLMFVDDAIVETYSYMHPPRKGIATTLVEVGAWR